MRVDDPELSLLAAGVGAREPVDDLRRAQSLAEEREPVGAVAWVRVGLGGDRADVRLRPRHDRSDGQELGLGRDTPLTRGEIAGADRVRRDGVSHVRQS